MTDLITGFVDPNAEIEEHNGLDEDFSDEDDEEESSNADVEDNESESTSDSSDSDNSIDPEVARENFSN